MTVAEFLDAIPSDRKPFLTTLHEAIIADDHKVVAVIKPMMGKEMILYEERGYMKYALASAKNYISFHCMPIYLVPEISAKYTSLLPAAKFQKGCINFTDATEMPLETFADLVKECSLISTATMLENRKKKK